MTSRSRTASLRLILRSARRARLEGRGGPLPQREHRVDEIVAGALLAELDLEAVGEEGEEVDEPGIYGSPFVSISRNSKFAGHMRPAPG
jgi:hypothetical protein